MHLHLIRFIFTFAALLPSVISKAQLTPADSAWFQTLFTAQVYFDTVYSGNWYLFNPANSVAAHLNMIDTQFKYKTADLDSIDYLSVNDFLTEDTAVNPSFNNYPLIMSQANPLVYLPFTFLNNQSASWAYRYKDTNQTDCKNAFFVLPGNGQNQSIDIVRGYSYHNQLCFVTSLCQNYGDVYTYIKPNHDARAFHWSGKRLNEDYLLTTLINADSRYGINYLVEIIAMIKYLKANYDRVFVFGLSEGGYAALLSTMYIQPDAALISGGYSIDLDSNVVENTFLRLRFDTQLDTFHRVKVKNKVSASKTNYLFTWGENDPVPTMDPEHDFHHTQNYFGPLTNCSYFYDFFDHTFPPCFAIDSFIQRNLAIPLAHFRVTDSTMTDTLFTQVNFCRPGLYSFDLFKDTTLVSSYSLITDSLQISLSDTGRYFIANITDSNAVQGKCNDTISCTKYAVVSGIAQQTEQAYQVQYNNPFSTQLSIRIIAEEADAHEFGIYSSTGVPVFQQQFVNTTRISLASASWPAGLYFMKIRSKRKGMLYTAKALKL